MSLFMLCNLRRKNSHQMQCSKYFQHKTARADLDKQHQACSYVVAGLSVLSLDVHIFPSLNADVSDVELL